MRRSLASPVLVAALLLLAAMPSSAGAASPVTIGNGSKPGVAVDAAGTAYIAWYGPESNISTLRFCRLPRGASACDAAFNIDAPATSLSRPFVTVSGSTVRIVHYRYGLSGSPFSQVYEFVSTDRGQSFGAGSPVGYPPFDEGVQGPGDTVSVATNAFSEGLVFQNMPLGGGSAGDQRAVLSSDHPYNGTVGLVDAGTPLVAFSNGASFTQFRRYTGSGSVNDAASWTPATDIGYADYPRLAGGPSGLFMIAGTEAGAIVARKYDGTTFTPGRTIVATGGNDAQQHITQDAAGRLHAVFPRGDAEGLHVGYATSDNGTVWQRSDLLLQKDGGIDELRAAVAPDHIGVVAWSTRINTGAAAGTIAVRVAGIGPSAAKPNGRLPKAGKPPATAKRLRTARCASPSPGSSAGRRAWRRPPPAAARSP